MDHIFDIHENTLGYFNDPIEKIIYVATKYIEKTQAPCSEEIKIKISVDGLQLTRTHRQILTVTFTLLNENKRATTSKGNYLLGKLNFFALMLVFLIRSIFFLGLFEIEKESYQELETALKEILETLASLSSIQVNNSTYNVKKLGGDLKCLANMYGINAAISNCPCIWCKFNVKENSNIDGSWPVSRTLDESNAWINDPRKTSAERQGYVRKPLINFIDFDHCVVDTLHLYLRISECLLKDLIIKLNEADGNEFADISRRPNLNLFLDFLKNDCKIYAPYYTKHKDSCIIVKLRSMNSNELDSFFTKLNEISLISLMPGLEEILQGIDFCLREFFNIFKVISGNQLPSVREIENRLHNWLIVFTQIGATNSTRFTPYINILVHHVPEFLRVHGNLQTFNCQGLEKLNHIVK